MDSLGAVAGPLIAAPLIALVGFRALFGFSILPGMAAAAVVMVLVSEVPTITKAAGGAAAPMRSLLTSPGPFRRLVLGVGLYGLGNFSATLLILRATGLLAAAGRGTAQAAALSVLLYAAHNAANALAAYPGGALADRIGRRSVLVAGIVLFALACVGLAFGSANLAVLLTLFVGVGASAGLVETGQGSLAAEILTQELRGRGFGLLGFVEGIGDFLSSAVVGVLWTVMNPAWGFLYAAAFALAGAGVLARTAASGPNQQRTVEGM
jgi:MFS family permease